MTSNPPDTMPTGLSTAQADDRLRAEGFNELPSTERRSFVHIVLGVLRQPMFILLIAGGVVYLLLGDRIEALMLLGFACLSVGITIVQESRSERVLDTLRSLASPRARVLRDGRAAWIPGRDVVRGDLLLPAEGERVAADATLLSGQDLLVDESMLTGESVPVRKRPSTATNRGGEAAEPGGEDSPHLFAGTLVVRGDGQARVHATGRHTQMGAIGRALSTVESVQPRLQAQLQWLIRDFAIVGIVVGGLAVVLYGVLRGSWLEALLGGIALGMSLVPEEFPLVLAVFMAMGAWRISRARVLTRRAAAIETLGATTVLCTDKTGTLTENRMRVAALQHGAVVWTRASLQSPDAALVPLLESALGACPKMPSDPMDLAIHDLAVQVGGTCGGQFASIDIERAYGLRPDLFAVANVWRRHDGISEVHAKGAPEAIASLCGLSGADWEPVKQVADAYGREGIRVLAVATTTLERDRSPPESLRDLQFTFLGLVGLSDPLRADVPDAVAQCRSAGIRIVMITGDYPATALAIARQAGLDAQHVLSGAELDALSDAELADRIDTVSVFARVRPTAKLRLVQALRAKGNVVAMTGDGVNDAPAIKAADIGIAMGNRGTDVAREAASIVLLDDDFGSIVKTIRLGRRIYDNLCKAIEYIVAVHIPIAGLALLPLLLGLPLILTPLLIAFLEMIIDPACSIVFEAEEEEENVMRRPPREPSRPLLGGRRLAWALIQGFLSFAIVAALLLGAVQLDLPEADVRALVFLGLVLVNLGLILVNRSFSGSLFRAFGRPNPWLWRLVGGVGLVLAFVLYLPALAGLFRFGTLDGSEVGAALVAGAGGLLVLEALKTHWFERGR